MFVKYFYKWLYSLHQIIVFFHFLYDMQTEEAIKIRAEARQ